MFDLTLGYNKFERIIISSSFYIGLIITSPIWVPYVVIKYTLTRPY